MKFMKLLLRNCTYDTLLLWWAIILRYTISNRSVIHCAHPLQSSLCAFFLLELTVVDDSAYTANTQ